MKIYMFKNKIMSFNNVWFKEPDQPVYPSVVIGTQMWMTESLSINDGGAGIAVLNGVTYYTQAAAIRVANSIPGWHLPTKTEFDTLLEYVGGSDISGVVLASTSGWVDEQGLDEYGFNAKPYGRYYDGSAIQYGAWAPFWASTNEIYDLDHTGDLLDIGYESQYNHWIIAYMTSNFKTDYYQARLIKD